MEDNYLIHKQLYLEPGLTSQQSRLLTQSPPFLDGLCFHQPHYSLAVLRSPALTPWSIISTIHLPIYEKFLSFHYLSHKTPPLGEYNYSYLLYIHTGAAEFCSTD